MAVWSTGQPVNLANAFVKPVRPASDTDLIAASIEALDRYWGSYPGMYGDDRITDVAVATLEPYTLNHIKAKAKSEAKPEADTASHAETKSPGKTSAVQKLIDGVMARVPVEKQS